MSHPLDFEGRRAKRGELVQPYVDGGDATAFLLAFSMKCRGEYNPDGGPIAMAREWCADQPGGCTDDGSRCICWCHDPAGGSYGMTEYQHWHQPGDVNTETPPCCVSAIEDAWRRRVDDAVHDERKRVILEAVAATEAYGEGARSVLDDDKAAFVGQVLIAVIVAIKRTGCICPMVDVSTFKEPPNSRFMRGGDGRCGMHETEATS